MDLTEYIAAVMSGALQINAGALVGNTLVETTGVLDPTDLAAVTAEAFNQDVFSADVTWADAYAQIVAALQPAPVAKSRRLVVRVTVKSDDH